MSDDARQTSGWPRPEGHIWTEADAHEWALYRWCPWEHFGVEQCADPCEGCVANAWSDINDPPRALSDYPDAQIGKRLLAKLKAEGKR